MEHSQEHQEFSSEAVRAQRIQVGISRTIDTLPFKHAQDLTRVAVVDQVINKFREAGHQFAVKDNGWVVMTDKQGRELDLKEETSEVLLCDKTLRDEESVASAVEAGTLGISSKEDLRTTEAKVRYIRKFGQDAFAKLPLKRQPKFVKDPTTMTREQYLSLPISERCKFNDRQIFEMMQRK